jgi:hypothetical protein
VIDLRRAFVAALLTTLLSISSARAAPATPPGCAVGYTFAFFNGVGNDHAAAIDGLNALRFRTAHPAGVTVTPDTYDPSGGIDQPLPVSFELFYNQSGVQNGAGIFQDVSELFVQRAREADPSSQIENRYWYLIWDAFQGARNGISLVLDDDANLGSLLVALGTTVLNALTDSLAALVQAPPTAQDYALHRAQLDKDIAAGNRLLMVAHSQGNVFVDKAYDYVMPQVGAAAVKVAHIAPASGTLRGSYELSSNDLVINALRLKGVANLPDNNLDLPLPGGFFDACIAQFRAASSDVDCTGHYLINSYLNAAVGGLAPSQALVTKTLTAITAPPTCAVTLSPPNAAVAPGKIVSLAGKTPTLNPGWIMTFDWAITGNAGGYFKNPVTMLSSAKVTTTSLDVVYNAPDMASEGQQDVVKVTAFLANIDQPGVRTPVDSKSAAISIKAESVGLISPPRGTLAPGKQQAFTIARPAAPAGATLSYSYSNTGVAGVLSVAGAPVGGAGATSTCAASAQIVYTANTAAVGLDTLGVEVFDRPGCAPGGGTSLAKGTADVNVMGVAFTIVDVDKHSLKFGFGPGPNDAANTAGGYAVPINAALSGRTAGIFGGSNVATGKGDWTWVQWTGTAPGTYPCFTGAEGYTQGIKAAGPYFYVSYGLDMNTSNWVPAPLPPGCRVVVDHFGTNEGDLVSGTATSMVWFYDQIIVPPGYTVAGGNPQWAADLTVSFRLPYSPKCVNGQCR